MSCRVLGVLVVAGNVSWRLGCASSRSGRRYDVLVAFLAWWSFPWVGPGFLMWSTPVLCLLGGGDISVESLSPLWGSVSSGRRAPYSCRFSGARLGGVPADINSSRRCLSVHWGSNWTWGRSCVWRCCTQGPGVHLSLLSRFLRFWRLLLVLEARCGSLGASSWRGGVAVAFLMSSVILLGGLRRAGGSQRRCGGS